MNSCRVLLLFPPSLLNGGVSKAAESTVESPQSILCCAGATEC